MSAMLTADWFLLGRDTYYRKFEIYSMEWQQEVNMDNVIVSGCSYGGPIAVIRDKKKFVKVQSSGRPVIAVYSGSGRQMSSVVWSKGQLMTFGWSDREHLLCVQDDGKVIMHDMFTDYQHEFSISQETYDHKIIDARIFSSVLGTGVAVMTASYKILLVNNVYDAKKRILAELPHSDMRPNCWAVVSEERSTDVLLARERNLYHIKEHNCINVVPDISHQHTEILEIAVSLNARHVALFTDAGYLWLGSVDFRTKYCEINTNYPQTPKQLVWCGTEAVIGYWNTKNSHTVHVYNKQGENINYIYDGCVDLIPEIDGVRVLSSMQHEMIQKVPDVVQKIFRINSTDPGSYLLEASKQYQKRSHRADEYMCLVKDNLKLAVNQCIEAAGYEFDPDVQKMLIRAAQFGKCFIEDMNPDQYVTMCQLLRVLNAIRNPRIGLPLTFTQVQHLTFKTLLDRLVARKHYCLAIEIAKYIRLMEQEGVGRILSHWANYKVMQSHLKEDTIAKEIAEKLATTSNVSFDKIARTAANNGRKQLAIKLLDYEPKARLQVPLLLKLGEDKPALLKAIESGDTDLMYTVILHMRENMPLADFRMTIRNFPVAQALYKKYCKENNYQALVEIHMQEDDFAAQAAGYIKEANESVTKEVSLMAAQDAFRKAKNDFYASLCEESQKLIKAQSILEDNYKISFLGKSVHDTCSMLLSMSEIKAADKFRSDFKIPDKRYWWLRITHLAELDEWTELEKFSKAKKSPIGYGPFVQVCLQENKDKEALKYLPRVHEDYKIKYYVKAKLYEDAVKIALEQKNLEGLLYIQRSCDTQHSIQEKIKTYISQLSYRK